MRHVKLYRHRNANSGLTLIEVLASVTVLSLFLTVLLSLLSQGTVISRSSAGNQQAMILAQNMLVDMANTGATTVIGQGPQTVKSGNGITYTLLPSQVFLPGNEPIWTDGGVYAEVKVTWPAFQNGQKVTKSIDLKQLFAN